MTYSASSRTETAEMPRLVQPLRRHALPLLSAALLAGGITYGVAARQAPTYATMSSVVSVNNGARNLPENSLIRAPSLAPDVLQEALRDPTVIADIVRRILASDLPPTLAHDLARTVEAQQNSTTFKPVTVTFSNTSSSRADLDLYEVWGRTHNPTSAQVLVNASVDALREWDRERALQQIALARTSLQQQLAALSRNAPPIDASNARWDAYEATRAQLLRSLAQVELLSPAAVGTLEVVARAPEPTQPAGPGPLRRAILAALLTLFVAGAAVLLYESWRRRVYDAQSLRELGLPLLGQLPGLPAGTAGRGVAAVLHSGPLQDSLGFLRVNVLSQLTPDLPRRLVFSGIRDETGTSSVVAALATSLAGAGQRVLIVDTHPQASQHMALWSSGNSADRPTFSVAERIDLLPLNDSDPARAQALAEQQLANHDIVLIDTPPILRRSDALLWASRSAGIVLVLDPGRASQNEVEQVLQSAQLARVRVLGAVLNELRLASEPQQATAGQRKGERVLAHGEASARSS
ncbi:cellulose synthase operon protein YhjQ/BcsQ [Deinococcus sp. DB0503]|uniref:cellulose synthase operon protein YhjQ/BcsQ n=1 Tax=Deinococcus sp. DB0503 TaxID=2479203 RepID=UPI0018DF86EE|nr:cellulose synthase operon protein YhjQ/BcsQ [Deinococcus sp. DB0503]MBI0447148.1 succinoglycan biosynthesis protein exop [Deinococcus sp. DB0503]